MGCITRDTLAMHHRDMEPPFISVVLGGSNTSKNSYDGWRATLTGRSHLSDGFIMGVGETSKLQKLLGHKKGCIRETGAKYSPGDWAL
jgi:hypothetical protein